MTTDQDNIKPTTCNGQCKFIETMFMSICTICGDDDYPKSTEDGYDTPPPPETKDSHFN